MKAKEFIIENETLAMLHHIKRYSPVAKNIDFAYCAPDPNGKYFQLEDVEGLLAEHGATVPLLKPLADRSGYRIDAGMVVSPKGQYVRVHDVINAISGMHDGK